MTTPAVVEIDHRDPVLRAAFCDYVPRVFRTVDFRRWCEWGEWNDDYRAFSVLDEGRVVANASVMLPTGAREEVQIYDISRGGFCFDLKEALPVGEIMRVGIQLPWMRSDLLLSGTVRWSRGALHGAQIVASPVSDHDEELGQLIGEIAGQA